MTTPAPDPRCLAQGLLPSGHWKRCVAAAGHLEQRHLWLESFTVIDRAPILVIWFGVRNSEPLIINLPVDYTRAPEIIRKWL